jgi:hypothetical protein
MRIFRRHRKRRPMPPPPPGGPGSVEPVKGVERPRDPMLEDWSHERAKHRVNA